MTSVNKCQSGLQAMRDKATFDLIKEANAGLEAVIAQTLGVASLFQPHAIDKTIMSAKDQLEFCKLATPFEYWEPAGHITGYKSEDGRVLITKCTITKENHDS